MRIVCPQCAAAYEVPDAVLGSPGRRVRCARCGREWETVAGPPPPMAPASPLPPVDAPPPAAWPSAAPLAASLPATSPSSAAPPASADPMLIALDPLVERTGRRRSVGPVRAGWGATLVVLVAALAAAYVWRVPIEAAWPPSQRAYAVLGLR